MSDGKKTTYSSTFKETTSLDAFEDFLSTLLSVATLS